MILSPGNELELGVGDWLSKNVESTGKSSFPTLEDMQAKHILDALEQTKGKISGNSGRKVKILY